MLEVVRIIVCLGLVGVCLYIGIMLSRGKMTQLVFSDSAPFENKAQSKEQAARDRSLFASPVPFSSAAVIFFLLLFGIFRQLGMSSAAYVCTILCDLSMVAFVVLVVRLYIKLGAADDKKAKFRTSNVRISLFVLVQIVILLLVALLF